MDRRNKYLLKTYGISEKQYLQLLKKQNFSCAVCHKHQDLFKTRLNVDHDHRTGEIRGLLCYMCNHRVVGRHRDPELLFSASQYLRQGTGLYVPEKKKRKRRRR